MITIHAWLLYVLLVVAVVFGLMLAGLFRAGRITELENALYEKELDESLQRHPAVSGLRRVSQWN